MDKLIFVLMLLALPAHAQYIGLSVGQSQIPDLFNHSRFAFPDLAQGGPGCCNQMEETGESGIGLRFSVGKSLGRGFGIEGSFANLGTSSVAFHVSGPFGNSLQGPGYGECVESGDFRISSVGISGTYSYGLWGGEVVPKLGLSANWLKVKTQSHCDLKTSVDVAQDYTRFSVSPLVGLGIKYPMTNKLGLSLDVEGRRVTFSDNEEANKYGQGKPVVTTAWLGLERRF